MRKNPLNAVDGNVMAYLADTHRVALPEDECVKDFVCCDCPSCIEIRQERDEILQELKNSCPLVYEKPVGTTDAVKTGMDSIIRR